MDKKGQEVTSPLHEQAAEAGGVGVGRDAWHPSPSPGWRKAATHHSFESTDSFFLCIATIGPVPLRRGKEETCSRLTPTVRQILSVYPRPTHCTTGPETLLSITLSHSSPTPKNLSSER